MDTPRHRRRILAALLTVVLAAAAALTAATTATAATPASRQTPTDYKHYSAIPFGFWDQTGSRVWTKGTLDYYYDGSFLPVYRGQFRTGSRVVLAQPGCAFVKVTWHRAAVADVTWPPVFRVETTTDGWFSRCAAAGTPINIGGVAYASHALNGTTLCIGYAPDRHTPRKYDACYKM